MFLSSISASTRVHWKKKEKAKISVQQAKIPENVITHAIYGAGGTYPDN
jgi:hypothetical protein